MNSIHETDMALAPENLDWAADVAALLEELSSVQDDLLAVLRLKREALVTGDLTALAELQGREQALAARLKACQGRRLEQLASARKAGLAVENLGKLAHAAKGALRGKFGREVKSASPPMQLLRNEAITNWVLAQKSLLLVSQQVEMIATGGRPPSRRP